jgi:hypothetical protein
MSNYARQYDDSQSNHNNVIPFNHSPTSSKMGNSVESLLSDALSNPEIETHLKGIVEAAVFEACLKIRLLDVEPYDDPFDAIYISELQADPIISTDINQLQKYANIIDLSNTISFEDEWED